MTTQQRTRIKLCGLSRPDDVAAAVEAGADAIGLVFYPPSPRHVTPAQAGELLAGLPAYITAVGLFVNPDETLVRAVVARRQSRCCSSMATRHRRCARR